jgi:DnaJ-class molecular chaperone
MGFWTRDALALWGPNARRPQITDALMRICPLCNGTGLNPKLITHVCPKCQGEKKVPR